MSRMVMVIDRRITAISVALLWLVTAAHATPSGISPVPSVALQLADGTTVNAASYKGKVLLIDFWASWCVPCKTSFPALDGLYQRYRDQGLQVVAVNLDERLRDADAFLARHPHVMPVAFDARGDSAKAFGVRGMPSSILIDRRGNIRFTHMGYSAKVFDRYRDEITLLLSER